MSRESCIFTLRLIRFFLNIDLLENERESENEREAKTHAKALDFF